MVYDLHPIVIIMVADVGRDDDVDVEELRHVKDCGDAKVGGPTPQMMSTRAFWPFPKLVKHFFNESDVFRCVACRSRWCSRLCADRRSVRKIFVSQFVRNRRAPERVGVMPIPNRIAPSEVPLKMLSYCSVLSRELYGCFEILRKVAPVTSIQAPNKSSYLYLEAMCSFA